MANPRLNSSEKVFEHADSFYQAFLALRRLQPFAHVNMCAAVASEEPIIVLSALASELFLKCLICIEMQSSTLPRDHNLKRLFDQLSGATRKRIAELWDRDVVPRRRQQWNDWERLGLKVARDLPSALSKGEKAFQIYRYSYEENTDGVHYYLDDLTTLLQTVILEMKPDFAAWRRPPLASEQTSHH